MVDNVSSTTRSRTMQRVRSKGNASTELRLLAILKKEGLSGWRRHASATGRPDFIFPKQRIALFVDGCFWHGCAKCCRIPATNRKYWTSKIRGNILRDRKVGSQLRREGWIVLRIWEHELKNLAPTRKISKLRFLLLGKK